MDNYSESTKIMEENSSDRDCLNEENEGKINEERMDLLKKTIEVPTNSQENKVMK